MKKRTSSNALKATDQGKRKPWAVPALIDISFSDTSQKTFINVNEGNLMMDKMTFQQGPS